MRMDAIAPQTSGALPQPADRVEKMHKAATQLEATFISEMLKAAKFGEPRSSFGGGPGEAQFASFLRSEVAKDMAANGGIWLGEVLFEAMNSLEVAQAR